MNANRNRLAEEQMEALRQNPYVLSVTQTRIPLTKEFKELFHHEYSKGATPKEILERHGFDITALGKCRIHSIGVNIRKEYERYGGFHQGYLRLPKQPDPETSVSPPKTEAEQIRRLQHEVEYLKQEIEFLKKISSLKNIRKQVHCS